MSAVLEKFLEFSRAATIGGRVGAARALTRAYLSSRLSAEEREGVEAAMTILLDDSSVDVRLTLANELADSDRAPVHVIMGLASDSDTVSVVVAARSPVILDSELVDMVAVRGEPVQLAIARRPFLSRAVSAAIGEVCGPEPCRALIENPGARVPRFTLDRIVARHGSSPELRMALLERSDLPIEVREVLLGRLAEDLRALIVAHGWTTPERAAIVTRDAHECATIAAAFEAPAENMPALVDQLIEGEALTPAFLVRAVASGQVALFEASLAALAGVPARRVAALIASGRQSNLRALLRKAKLPPKTFPVFAAAIDVIRRDDLLTDGASVYRRATHLIDAIVGRYELRQDREMDQLLLLLRRFARDAKRQAARGYLEHLSKAA